MVKTCDRDETVAPARRRAGFTLLEISIVVALIGLLSAMALPSFMKARQESKISVMVNDIRIIHDAFQMYAMDNNGYPQGHGFVPAPVTNYLSNARWAKPTALGGHWLYYDVSDPIAWSYFQTRLLVVDDFRIDPGQHPIAQGDQWRAIDAIVDDGDLATGMFKLIGDVQMQYSLEEKSWPVTTTSTVN